MKVKDKMISRGMKDQAGLDKTHLEKVVLAKKIGAFLNNDPSVDEKRTKVVLDLANLMVNDISAIVRQTLAFEVRRSQYLPKEIALKIVHDIEEVSGPFLTSTPIFDDDELAELVSELPEHAMLSISRRKDIGPQTSVSLSQFGTESVATTLLQNKGAHRDDRSYNIIVKRFSDQQHVMDLVAGCEDLGIEVVIKIVDLVSKEFKKTLMENYGVEYEQAKALLEETNEDVLAKSMYGADIQQLEIYARDIRQSGMLNGPFILNMIRRGNPHFFVAAMAVLVDRDVETIEAALNAGGGIAVERLVLKAGLGKEYVKMFRVLMTPTDV
jgi:uncharacterized protein (DUF2336 family)